MDYYSLPFTPKPHEESRFAKVDAETSVRQHIRLMLSTMPGSFRFDPVYGSLLNKHHFLLPDKRKGDKKLEQELKLKLQNNLKALIAKHEPRLIVDEIEVEVNPGRNENDSRITFLINISGSINGRESFKQTESFFLK